MFKNGTYHIKKETGGFTLIELLVVISIVALLISILLPALAKARASSQRMQCQVNLRSIATAARTYSSDYGVYPRNNYSAGGTSWWWYKVIVTYLGSERTSTSFLQNATLHCPTNSRMAWSKPAGLSPWSGLITIGGEVRSYCSYNLNNFQPFSGGKWVRPEHIIKPSSMAMSCDTFHGDKWGDWTLNNIDDHYGVHEGASNYEYLPTHKVLGPGNVLYSDGHCVTKDHLELSEIQLPVQ
jgi:prepilin-type N-terminal cleavage/methylation domain-containing protein